MNFKDHFSGHASDYAKYRPTYPADLFEFLAQIVPNTKQAWDCATGNGQAARELVKYFDQVVATDASARQIENAIQHEKIDYCVAPAESTDIETASCDLVVVAQALHWFDSARFYKEAKRVLSSDGVLAVWGYALHIIDSDIDKIIHRFYSEKVGDFWPQERCDIEDGFSQIPFPLRKIECPDFSMRLEWNLYDLCGYINTWSAVKKYVKQNNEDPISELAVELKHIWGEPKNKKKIKWPLFMKAGKFKDEH